MTLNETYSELIALFKKAGVAEPEYPHLEWEIARQCWLFYDNSKSSFFERWFEQDHLVRDLLASHFERLWCGLDNSHEIDTHTPDKNISWRILWSAEDKQGNFKGWKSVKEHEDKLCAILLAMRSKYGGEDGAA